jgi:hypothetical protein
MRARPGAWAALVAVLLVLSGCFTSETPLIGAEARISPFSGDVYLEDQGADRTRTLLRRSGDRYDMFEADGKPAGGLAFAGLPTLVPGAPKLLVLQIEVTDEASGQSGVVYVLGELRGDNLNLWVDLLGILATAFGCSDEACVQAELGRRLPGTTLQVAGGAVALDSQPALAQLLALAVETIRAGGIEPHGVYRVIPA